MKIEKVTHWLTLLANIGVLVGIAFLALEIKQTNEIAMRDARVALAESSQLIDILILENPDLANLMSKLNSRNPKLSDLEEAQANSVVIILLNRAARLSLNLETGFFTEDVSYRHLEALLSLISTYPGLAPILSKRIEVGRAIPTEGSSPIYDAIYKEVRLIENQ